jgi:hypothetical protein
MVGTRQLLAARFAALCEQVGMHARRIPPPSELPELLRALWLLGVDVVAQAPPQGSPPPLFAPPPIPLRRHCWRTMAPQT